MAAKLIEVFNNCKCVGEEQHLAAGEVRSLAFGDNRSVMVIELGLHEVVKRDTLAKAEKQLASAYGLDRVCIEPRYEHAGRAAGRVYHARCTTIWRARMPSAQAACSTTRRTGSIADGALHIPMDDHLRKAFRRPRCAISKRVSSRETGRSCPVHAVPLGADGFGAPHAGE